MSLFDPWNGSYKRGQSLMSCAPASVVGLKAAGRGRANCAPADSAALAMPESEKQLSGSLIGLSVTIMEAAPAPKQAWITATTKAGLVVAESDGGEAKAAFTLSTTRSPRLINRSIPPSACSARLTVFARSTPVTMLSLLPAEATEKSGSVTGRPAASADGPWLSCSQRPTPPAAATATPALAARARKSRRSIP